ncbi:30S ribosomal protein S8 [Candidatus Mesenet endosymbiont of Agriotes lineatus]|uniref:30S ribosomal protein S8 n=1 Tax=Candidatus Mesenet endosymbiont of Agriotes lineatus TaxID=3077948 RepID=UPI0030D5EE2E
MANLCDFLTRIRNAQLAMMKIVEVPFSGMRGSVLKILQDEGYITYFDKKEVRSKIFNFIIELKYYNNMPVIHEIKAYSKPGRRIYSTAREVPRFYNGLGIIILSTSKGVISDFDARKSNVGGEVLCGIF